MTNTDWLSLRNNSFIFFFIKHSSIIIINTIVETAMSTSSIADICDSYVHLKWYLLVCNNPKECCSHKMCTCIAPNRWYKTTVDWKSIPPTHNLVMSKIFIKKSFNNFLWIWSTISKHRVYELEFLDFMFYCIHNRRFEIFVFLGSWGLLMDQWAQPFHWKLSYSGGYLLQYESRGELIIRHEH